MPITTTVSAANTYRHENSVVTQPPISGPAAIATAAIPPSSAYASARSRPSYVAAVSAAIAGTTSTAPNPSTPDQPIRSTVRFGLSAVVSDPTP